MQKTYDLAARLLVRLWWPFVAIIALLVLVLSMYMSIGQSFWFDENYSILLSQQPIHELVRLTSVDAHPPLYYMYLKLWGDVFGTSEFALRLSSAVFGAGTLVVVLMLCRKLFSAKTALIVAPFVALAPFLTRYYFEIRMYAVVTFIGVLATYILVKAVGSKGTKWWILYSALVVIGMYTLYMSAVIWLAHLIWLIHRSRQNKLSLLNQPFWLAYISAFVLFTPWIPTVFYQLTHSALPPYLSPVTPSELTGIVSMLLMYQPYWNVGAWTTLFLGALFAAGIRIWIRSWPRMNKNERSSVLLLLSCFIVAIVFYALTSLPPIPPHFMDRYIVHVAVYAYILIGLTVAFALRFKMHRSACAMGVLSIGLMLFGMTSLHREGNYNYQRLQSMQAATIRQSIGCDQTTYVTAGPYGYIDLSRDFAGCDLRYYEPSDVTFTGGFAPVNTVAGRIKTSNGIESRRLVFVYYDDSTVTLHPDGRYKKVGQQDFDKTHLVIYERS